MLETLKGFQGDDNGDDDQGNGVNKGGQDTYAVIAKGFARIGRPLSLYCSKPGQAKRENVGYDMTGVRE